jgi:hypothetical protein
MNRNVLTLICFLMMLMPNADAQSIYKEVPSLSFAKFDSNMISFPGDPRSFDFFYKKLDRLIFHGKGQINIVHFGGSHIQADIISHRFRRHLLSIQDGLVSGRGLIFPFSAAKTNNPWNYKTTYKGKWIAVRNVQRELKTELGVSGIAVMTSDSTAQFTITMRKTDFPSFEFHRIKIMCAGDTCGVEPVLMYNDKRLSCTLYDSIHHAYVFNLPLNVCEFTVGFKGFYSASQSIAITGIILENDKPGIIYHSIGVNGASLPSYLQCVNFERDLSLLKPDLVILAIGINDANATSFSTTAFERNYIELIDKIRRVNPYCALLFSTNNDSYRKNGRRYYVNENNTLVRDVFFKLAEEYHAGVWDLYTIMGGKESMQQWEEQGLAKVDKIHFTTAGYELLGDLLFNSFWQGYTNYIQSTLREHKKK